MAHITTICWTAFKVPAKVMPMSFTITLQPSEKSFACGPGIDILRAGLSCGVAMRYSCRSGVCRTCRGRLVSGKVDFGDVHPHYLSEEEKAQGHVHLCCARPLSDCTFEIEPFDPHLAPTRTLPVRVLHMEQLAPDVMRLLLGTPPNEPLTWRAGQYLEIVLGDGVRRCYSMANAPRAGGLRQIELHIRHMPGGRFTDHVFGRLRERDLLRVEAPQGSFFVDEDSDKPVVMLASGTGFAPIQAMVEASLAQGLRRPIDVYWGGRQWVDLYLDAHARRWAAENEHVRYVPVLSGPCIDPSWTGRSGFVHLAVLQDHPDLSGHQVYACGAPPMVDAARRDFNEAGLPVNQFFADAFVSEADRRPAPL